MNNLTSESVTKLSAASARDLVAYVKLLRELDEDATSDGEDLSKLTHTELLARTQELLKKAGASEKPAPDGK